MAECAIICTHTPSFVFKNNFANLNTLSTGAVSQIIKADVFKRFLKSGGGFKTEPQAYTKLNTTLELCKVSENRNGFVEESHHLQFQTATESHDRTESVSRCGGIFQ